MFSIHKAIYKHLPNSTSYYITLSIEHHSETNDHGEFQESIETEYSTNNKHILSSCELPSVQIQQLFDPSKSQQRHRRMRNFFTKKKDCWPWQGKRENDTLQSHGLFKHNVSTPVLNHIINFQSPVAR
jgi:hypothetical protein